LYNSGNECCDKAEVCLRSFRGPSFQTPRALYAPLMDDLRSTSQAPKCLGCRYFGACSATP
jgi:hypothetical protein